MTAPDGPNQPEAAGSDRTPTDIAALVESIYRISLEPHAYDTFMAQWDQHLSQAVEALRALRARAEQSNSIPFAPEIEKHFEIGMRLLEELGRSTLSGYFGETDDGASLPKLLLDKDGHVVWFNGRAQALFGLTRASTQSALRARDDSKATLTELVHSLSLPAEKQPRGTILRIQVPSQDRLIYFHAKPTQDRNSTPLLLLEELSVHWPAGMERLLADAFRLSHAECEVAALVAEGCAPQEIAARRGSSLATVRTQIKKILAKSGARGQPDLVRLLHAMMRVCEQQTARVDRVDRAVPKRMFQLRDRIMPAEIAGDPQGQPVIMFHGMLDGCAVPREMQALLVRKGFRLISPVRPWFGQAEGDNGPVAGAMERFARDVAQLCQHLSITRPIFLGHMAGSLYACAAAALMGRAVRGVVTVAGGVPILSAEQFRSMSRRQRLVAYTARYTPALLPFVVRAGIRQLDFGGERNFANALYESSPLDRVALENPEIYDMVRGGYHFTIAQGHRAFEIDAYHVVRDWTAMFNASDVPVHCLHGQHDPVVSIASVRAFARRYPNRVTLTELPDAGQLILYSRPKAVVDVLETMLGTPPDWPAVPESALYPR